MPHTFLGPWLHVAKGILQKVCGIFITLCASKSNSDYPKTLPGNTTAIEGELL